MTTKWRRIKLVENEELGEGGAGLLTGRAKACVEEYPIAW